MSQTPPTPISKEDLQNLPLDDDDDKTVVNDTYNVADKLKPYYKEAYNILDNPFIKAHKDSFNLFDNAPDMCKKLNKLIDKINNKKEGTSKLKTLTSLRKAFHYGQPLTYVKTSKK